MNVCMENGTRFEWIDTDVDDPKPGMVMTDYEYDGIRWTDIIGHGASAEVVAAAALVEALIKESVDWHYFLAAVQIEEPSTLDELIEIRDKIVDGRYIYYDVQDDYDLGVRIAKDCLDIPEDLAPYIDYAAIGLDERLGAGGMFTDWGYIA